MFDTFLFADTIFLNLVFLITLKSSYFYKIQSVDISGICFYDDEIKSFKGVMNTLFIGFKKEILRKFPLD